MNILEIEDIIKGLPDQRLQQEAQAPSGQLPQYLVVSEIQRRSDMRKRFQQRQPQNQGTVKDQILMEGIAAMAPQQPMTPPQMPMGQPAGPAMAPPMPQAAPPQMPPPVGMAGGGLTRMAPGGLTLLDQQTVSGVGSVRGQIDQAIAMGATAADLLTIFRNHPEVVQYIREKMAPPQPMTPSVAATMPDVAGIARLNPGAGERLAGAVQSAVDAVPGFIDQRTMAAQMNQPSYSMIAPSGLGFDDMSRYVPDISGAVDSAGQYIGSAVDSAGQYIGSAADSVGQFIADGTRGAVESIAYGANDIAAGAEYGTALRGLFGAFPGLGMLAALHDLDTSPDEKAVADTGFDEVMEVAQTGSTDASSPTPPVPTDGRRQGESQVQRQATEDARPSIDTGSLNIDLLLDGAPEAAIVARDAGTNGLGLEDLVGEYKQDALNNALIQLGAGIASDRLGEGIAAAGTALTEGRDRAKRVAIQQRLSQYEAGREDLARRDKMSIANRELDILEKRLEEEVAQRGAVGRNELFRIAMGLVEASMGESLILDAAERERIATQLMNKYLLSLAPSYGVSEAPQIGVDGGMIDLVEDPVKIGHLL